MSKQSTFSSIIARDVTGLPKQVVQAAGISYDEVADIPVTVTYEVQGDTIIVNERAILETNIKENNGEMIFPRGATFFLTDEEKDDIAEEIGADLVGKLIDYAYDNAQ